LIDEKPESANERAEVGHWEVDTMISRKSKASLKVTIEHKSRYTMINRLPSKTARYMKEKLVARMGEIELRFHKTITFDNGTENADHEGISEALRVKNYFCHPYHSWENGSVENAIGLIREYYTKRTSFSELSEKDLFEVEGRLNNRPRKCLGYRTPKEVFSSATALGP